MNDIYGRPVPRAKETIYNRILEVLADYYLDPNEDSMEIDMTFTRGREVQQKHLAWRR